MSRVHPPPDRVITRTLISPRGDQGRGDDSDGARVDAQRRVGSEIRTCPVAPKRTAAELCGTTPWQRNSGTWGNSQALEVARVTAEDQQDEP
jgi:hypothetical protein